MGSSNFWFDNWTRLGVLYFVASDDFPIDEDVMNVPEVLDKVSCNAGTHSHYLSEDIASHIIHEIQPPKFVDTHIWKILHLTMMVRYVSTFNSFEEVFPKDSRILNLDKLQRPSST